MRKVFRPAVWNSYNLRGQIGGGTNSFHGVLFLRIATEAYSDASMVSFVTNFVIHTSLSGI